MKRYAWWVSAGAVAAIAAWRILGAMAEDASNLQRLLDSLDAAAKSVRPIQLAQAEAPAAPAPEAPVPVMPAAPDTPATPAPEAPAPAMPPSETPDAPAMPPSEAPAAPAPEAPVPVMPAAPDAPVAPTPAAPSSDLERLLRETQPPPAPQAPMPAAEAPAAEAAPAVPALVVPQKPQISPKELEEQERVRRQAEEREGLKALADAQEFMRLGEYSKAFDQFQVAMSKIPDRPERTEALAQARRGRNEAALRLVEMSYEAARTARRNEQWEAAFKALSEARSRLGALDRPTTDQIADQKRWLARIDDLEAVIREDSARPVPLSRGDLVRAKAGTVADLLRQGREYFELEEYDEAERLFSQVLRLDPYNGDAMKLLRRIEERRLKLSELHRAATRIDLIQDIADKWNPPLRAAVAVPQEQKKEGAVSTSQATRLLQEKMQAIVIPSIEFRQANIVDVINFLRDASDAADPTGQGGVNIILKLDMPGGTPELAAAPAMPADPFAAQPTAGGDAAGFPGAMAPAEAAPVAPADFGGAASVPLITLNLRRVTLLDAIRYVTEVANLKYRIEENAVIITPRGAVEGTIVTRLYPVQPSIVEIVTTKTETDRQASRGEFVTMGGTAGVEITQQRDMKKFFSDMGVPFPPGTSISYNPAISQLIVRNTAENLEIFERILAALDVVPKQIEIEARFVEVAQKDLSELGFEWLLTDAWEIANKKGPGPIEAKERVQVNANLGSGGFTHGLRYFIDNSDTLTPAARSTQNAGQMAGNILSLSSILTNPELTVILHALEQRGGIDLLSSPRVTTRSGVNAQIKIVEELIYPTEYEQQSVGDLGTGFGTIISPITGAPLSPYAYRPPIPGSFETREIGVILNVTPTVGPDGYTIDLTLVPEVAEFVRWIDYGPAGLYPILQPVFASRNVTTSIVLWDGQTVVMGGLIRDQATHVDDRIPLLGHIPVLGALFRNKGQFSQKQNLVIFVTARLVDPAGAVVRPPKTGLQEIEARRSAAQATQP